MWWQLRGCLCYEAEFLSVKRPRNGSWTCFVKTLAWIFQCLDRDRELCCIVQQRSPKTQHHQDQRLREEQEAPYIHVYTHTHFIHTPYYFILNYIILYCVTLNSVSYFNTYTDKHQESWLNRIIWWSAVHCLHILLTLLTLTTRLSLYLKFNCSFAVSFFTPYFGFKYFLLLFFTSLYQYFFLFLCRCRNNNQISPLGIKKGLKAWDRKVFRGFASKWSLGWVGFKMLQ